MEASVIVDLSDDVEIENTKRKLDRKRFNEIKKYIPFLTFITEKDPVKNEKYIKLLQWFHSNKNLPARVAITCEYAINKRYQTLRSCMNFPPNIVSIFEGGGEAIDLISDDEDPPATESISLSKTEKAYNTNQQIEKSSSNTKSTQEQLQNPNTKSTNLKSPASSTTKTPSATITVTIEDGEVLSDSENDTSRNKENTHYVSLSEISLREPQKITDISSTTADDTIDDGSTKPIDSPVLAPSKEDSIQRSPILRAKNLERLSPETLSNDSENPSGVLIQKKKKKKHKHKKKSHSFKDGSDAETHSSSKKKKEKLKITRPLYVSDDDDEPDADKKPLSRTTISKEIAEEPEQVKEPVPVKEPELFQRREPVKKEDVPKSLSAIQDYSSTVVLLDSDDEFNNETPPTTIVNASQVKELQPSNSVISINPSVDQTTTNQSFNTHNQTLTPPQNKMKDLNSMDLSELNDIYAKLCEKTGIQLEELLVDLVDKSAVPKEQCTAINNENNANSLQTNEIPCYDNVQNNDAIELEEEQFQQLQVMQGNLQHHNQQIQQQQSLHYQQLQQPFPSNQHLNHNNQDNRSMVGSYSYQNSLMPKLNLNDPRIVQRLKQIKDSPIHNLSIRESATLLMNSFTQRPIHRNQAPTITNKITSSTATTYGEHKRLKELENQKLEQIKDKEKNNSSETSLNINSQINMRDPRGRKDSTAEKVVDSVPSQPPATEQSKDREPRRRKSSSASEGGRTTPIRSSADKVKSSSASESGRTTPNRSLANNTDSDDEKINMKSLRRRKSRQRIDSSSSALSNDTVEFQTNTNLTTNSNEESNILKVVQIVLSALNQKDDKSTSKKLSSRRNSTRKSSDSTKSGAAKSPKPLVNESLDNLNVSTNATTPSSTSAKSEELKTKRRRRKTIDSNKSPTKPKRGCRELENLTCTFKEYSDIFEKCSLETNNGKRLCSNGDQPDQAVIRAAQIGVRRKTVESRQTEAFKSNAEQAHKRLSTENRRTIESSSSDETDEFDIEEHRNINNKLQTTYKNIDTDPFDPYLRVTLEKLTPDEIHKWIKYDPIDKSLNKTDLIPNSPKVTSKNSNQHVLESPILVAITSKPVSAPKKSTTKTPVHLNDDINMTLNSTKTCALCNKRPMDLTNHYVVQHQTESYTSRLTSKEIEYLERNVTLAVRHHRNRYKVTCIFCQAELEDSFVNFHAHYSYHTGEFGFKCAVCDLVKPYREDVRSHQYRTSTCLNGKIRSNYLYSPDLVVIYLYVCTLCNFVQLNEANVQKHQRDHHNIRFNDPQTIKKCIIAAIDNGEILNEVMPADQGEGETAADDLLAYEREVQQLEQEFLDDNPLDIKDVVLVDQQLELSGNLKPDLNVNNGNNKISTVKDPPNSAEDDESISMSQISSVMTVIHTSNDETYPEDHRPLIDEPLDKKPQFKTEIQSKSSPLASLPTKMIYRQYPVGSNYFGLYKCTFNDCWFSSNEADRFTQHILAVHKINDDNTTILLNCAYCLFQCTNNQSFTSHVYAKHSLSQYQCAECAYRSAIPGNVSIHRKLYHQNSSMKRGTLNCAVRVSNLNERLTELKKKLMENVSPVKCQECSIGFYAISSLKSHMEMMHPRTHNNIDYNLFAVFVCLHCKEESNDKAKMRNHLALEHPDEIGYVAERKLKNINYVDSLFNLNMINISLPVAPAEINTPLIIESDDILPRNASTDKSTHDDPPQSKPLESEPPEETEIDDDVLLVVTPESTGPILTSTDEEKRLRSLLELFTEHTGPPTSSLYRCPYPDCIASFLHYELWQKHITVRHQAKNTVNCPYCPKQFSLLLGIMHFETHRRHQYLCYHCVMSFCSRENIFQHFAAFHPEFSSTIEKKIPTADVPFSIFKEKSDINDWKPLFEKLSDALRLQLSLRLQQNQHKEWPAGFSTTCLEEIEIPKFLANGQSRFKCLVKSCPCVASDEKCLMIHLAEHEVPSRYNCSQCAISQTNPTWESIKDHKMLHKSELHLCCVCNFLHYSFAGLLKHIEQFHSIRDVPVVSIRRNEDKYSTSIAIVLPENKMNVSTSDACFCCQRAINKKLILSHLRKDHKITLCPKCVYCNTIIHTTLDAELHAKDHQSASFKLKFELMTPYLYKPVINSTAPFNVEILLMNEKRQFDDNAEASVPKKIRLNDELLSVEIKKEVVVKTEPEEPINEVSSSSTLLKCVNLENLVQNPRTNTNNSSRPGVISVLPLSALTTQNHQQNQSVNVTYLANTQSQMMTYPPQTTPAISTEPQSVPVLRVISTQPSSFNEQFQTKSCEYLLPELVTICGNCGLECSDFAQLTAHFSAIHACKNQRFLFRVARKIECFYCSFQGSLAALKKHHETKHSKNDRLCRSLKDRNRCGVCYEYFTTITTSMPTQIKIACACPVRQILLVDCLDSNTLRVLQSFGQNYARYTCDICGISFNDEQLCRQHIVQVHKKASYPKLTCVEMMFVCYTCDFGDTSIDRIFEHIHNAHIVSQNPNWINALKKIKIIYRRGLTICAEDLRQIHSCHDPESLKNALIASEIN